MGMKDNEGDTENHLKILISMKELNKILTNKHSERLQKSVRDNTVSNQLKQVNKLACFQWGPRKSRDSVYPYSVLTTPIGLPTCQSFLFSFPSTAVTSP